MIDAGGTDTTNLIEMQNSAFGDYVAIRVETGGGLEFYKSVDGTTWTLMATIEATAAYTDEIP